MWIERAACAAVLLAAMAGGCGDGRTSARTADDPSPSASAGPERAGTLSVTAFRLTGWHDDGFHYLPALSVAAPSSSRPVFVQRVDFTAEEAGSRRLLKGVRYASAQRVQPGGTVELVPDSGSGDPAEIASPLALVSISAIVFFADDEGQTGIVSAAAHVPAVPDRAAVAAVTIRDFTVGRRQHQGRFVYTPQLTLAETSGRSHAAIKKIQFELLDAGAPAQVRSVWNAPEVPAGGAVTLASGTAANRPWLEIDSKNDAARLAVVISFVDADGRGGLVSAVAPVSR